MNALKEIIKRYNSESLTNDDLENLFIRYNSKKGNTELNKLLNNEWEKFVPKEDVEIDSDKIYQNIKKQISHNKYRVLKQNVKWLLPYAAIFIFIIITSLFIFYIKNYKSDAYLEAKTKYTSISTENGHRSKVVLPDSSIVWLNSGTTLSYQDNLFRSSKEVFLEGPAFFQVTRDKENPFKVQFNDFIVKVLGTRFDVNAYPETGKIAVVLESGKVELTHQKFQSFNYTMAPGELATFNFSDSTMNIAYADASIYSSWKDGKLIFRNSPMKEVLEKLKRWYNVNIEVEDKEVYNSIFTGTIQNESYEEIFRLIEIACPVNCRIQHNYEKESMPKIIVSKK